MPEPWERITGESAPAFQAFAAYRDMGADRSLAKVAQQLGKSTTLVERWSARDFWVNRVAAWDEEQDRIWRAQMVASRREVGKRQLRIANAMQGRLVDALSRLDVDTMTARDLGYWLQVTTQVQRDALGQGSRHEVTGADGGPVQVENLSPEQAKARLAEVQAEIARRLAHNPDAVPLEGAL